MQARKSGLTKANINPQPPSTAVVMFSALFLFLLHNHFITEIIFKKKSGDVNDEANFSLLLNLSLQGSQCKTSTYYWPIQIHLADEDGPIRNACLMCVLLLQDLLQSCARGGRRRVEDMCYERRRAEACVDESAHHALCVLFITAVMCVFITATVCTVTYCLILRGVIPRFRPVFHIIYERDQYGTHVPSGMASAGAPPVDSDVSLRADVKGMRARQRVDPGCSR